VIELIEAHDSRLADVVLDRPPQEVTACDYA
jgi:hypothetical protein